MHKIKVEQSTNVYTSWTAPVSVTIPANCVFSITGYTVYSATCPSGCALSYQNTNNPEVLDGYFMNAIGKDNQASCTYTGVNEESSQTYYLWCKYLSDSVNPVGICGFYYELS